MNLLAILDVCYGFHLGKIKEKSVHVLPEARREKRKNGNTFSIIIAPENGHLFWMRGCAIHLFGCLVSMFSIK